MDCSQLVRLANEREETLAFKGVAGQVSNCIEVVLCDDAFGLVASHADRCLCVHLFQDRCEVVAVFDLQPLFEVFDSLFDVFCNIDMCCLDDCSCTSL